ncbi:MAG: hypothetical protein WC616_01575 [Candidatus Omnitrophota bacterium]
MRKPIALGAVYTARATLFNSAGQKIGTCTDTPNAIAKAFMENRNATAVKECYSNIAQCRTEFNHRMNKLNDCQSLFRNK